MKNNNNICAIIITYNSGKDIIKSIKAVKNQVDKIIIIDNQSDKITKEYLEILNKKGIAKIIYNNINKGVAFALNQGIKYAIQKNYEWVLTLDQDSEPTHNMVSLMLDAYKKINKLDKDKIGIIAPSYIDRNLAKQDINRLKNKYQNVTTTTITTAITSGSLIRCSIFKQVGFYDEKLFIDYVDHEFCLRLNINGYKIYRVNNAILLHKLGESTSKKFFGKTIIYTNHSPIRRYYISRNRFYVWNKYYDKETEWVKNDIKCFIIEFIKIIFFERDKIKKFVAIFKGYRDYKKNIYNI